MKSRTKSTIINFLTDAVPQIVILLLGLFRSKLFIQILGNDQLGLYQLYGQIISYLVLLEGGVGTALLFRLYKPISEKDNKKISSIMAASKVIFNVVGTLILVVGFIISFFVGFFIKDNSFDFSYTQITFIIYLVSQAIYYFTIPYRVLFEADQKKYIPNTVFQGVTILKTIVEIIIVCSGLGLPEILISLVICSIIGNVIIHYLFKKNYKEVDFKEKKDFSMIKDVKDLFVNTLGNLVTSNIDIIIISKVIGLKFVVIYSTYNYFVEGIRQLVDKIAGATMSSVGDMLVSAKDKGIQVFNEFNEFVFFVATIICVPLFLFINQFINIWYNGNIHTSTILALLFTIILFYQIVKIPLKVFTFSSGKFKEVKRFVILEVIINLCLSIILVQYMGIAGVLVGTIVSMILADLFTKPFVIFKKIIHENVWKYYLRFALNTLFIICLGAIFYIILPKQYSNLAICIGSGVVFTIINFIIAVIYYFITKQYKFVYRFGILKNK